MRLDEDKLSGAYFGVIEVKLKGMWGRACINDWGVKEANVTCRQLGFIGGVPYLHISANDKPILMSNISCLGSESSLFNCNYTMFGDPEICHHGNTEAGVMCYSNYSKLLIVSSFHAVNLSLHFININKSIDNMSRVGYSSSVGYRSTIKQTIWRCVIS